MILVIDAGSKIVSLNDAAWVFPGDPTCRTVNRPGTVASYRALVRATLPGWDGDPAAVIVDEDGAPVAFVPRPAPVSRQIEAERAGAASQLRREIERSPLARAILEGGDLGGCTTEAIVAEQGRLLRLLFAALGDAVAWPDWTREARE
jgi:hypothetical protein